MWKKILKDLSLPESYISITLGFLVVIVAGLLIYNYFSKTQGGKNIGQNVSPTPSQQLEEISLLPATHTIAEKESLWTIAEKYYKSGYNWVTVAKENKIANPDRIFVGQKLVIPKAEPILLAGDKISSTATGALLTCTVVKGDNLWQIAIREYGDGFAWTKIAKANNLVNPNLIHPGNVLQLPR